MAREVSSRLVAVQPGVVLREVALPNNPDPTAQAQALASEFAPYWPKLLAIHTGKITALSLLGLRFEVDAPAQRDLERQFNILLASRLSAEPDTLVLERWRLNDALFEKSLAGQQTSPFWTGSSLIDGRLRWVKGDVAVNLRLRSPQGAESELTDQDTPDHLADLIGRLAEKIRQRPTATSTWKPVDEAHHYADLAVWCLNNRLYEEGVQAVESARALGDNSRATQALQVKAYAMLAYPDDLQVLQTASDNYRLFQIDPNSFPQRVAAATRTAQAAREYLKTNGSFSSLQWSLEDPIDLTVPALNTCLRILDAAYDNHFQANNADETAGLRHETRDLIADLGAKLLPQPPSMQRGAFLNYRAFYVALWNDTPAATLACYREMLKGGEIDGAWVRGEIFRGSCLREPFLDADGLPPHASPFQMGTPWLVAWDGRSPQEVKAIWQDFIHELASSTDLLSQCDALKFEVCSNQGDMNQRAVFPRVVAFFQQHPDVLSGPQKEEFAAGMSAVMNKSGQPNNPQPRRDFAQFDIGLLKKHALLPEAWIDEMVPLVYGQGSDEAAPLLLAALDDYGTWYKTQPGNDWRVNRAIDQFREAIYRSKQSLLPNATPSADLLNVTHFWKPELEAGAPSFRGAIMIDQRTLAVSDDGMAWAMTLLEPHTILGFDPATLQTVARFKIPPPLDPRKHVSRAHHRYLEVTPDWIVVGTEAQALLCSRANGQWRKLDVPPTCYKPRWVNKQLYLLYDAEFGDHLYPLNAGDPTAVGSGLIRVPLPDGPCQDLVSSRRVPPQNSLDGQPLGTPVELWSGAAGLSLAFYDHPIYTQAPGQTDWVPRKDISPVRIAKRTPGGVLLQQNYDGAHYGQLVLLNDVGSSVLVSDDGKARWQMPDQSDMPSPGDGSSPVMRGDDLCIYENFRFGANGGTPPCLVYFAKDRKVGVKIPLAFDYTQINDPRIAQYHPPGLGFDLVQATSVGLLLTDYLHRGVWVIPWTDIDAYRARLK
jgi:hypothetical protein